MPAAVAQSPLLFALVRRPKRTAPGGPAATPRPLTPPATARTTEAHRGSVASPPPLPAREDPAGAAEDFQPSTVFPDEWTPRPAPPNASRFDGLDPSTLYSSSAPEVTDQYTTCGAVSGPNGRPDTLVQVNVLPDANVVEYTFVSRSEFLVHTVELQLCLPPVYEESIAALSRAATPKFAQETNVGTLAAAGPKDPEAAIEATTQKDLSAPVANADKPGTEESGPDHQPVPAPTPAPIPHTDEAAAAAAVSSGAASPTSPSAGLIAAPLSSRPKSARKRRQTVDSTDAPARPILDALSDWSAGAPSSGEKESRPWASQTRPAPWDEQYAAEFTFEDDSGREYKPKVTKVKVTNWWRRQLGVADSPAPAGPPPIVSFTNAAPAAVRYGMPISPTDRVAALVDFDLLSSAESSASLESVSSSSTYKPSSAPALNLQSRHRRSLSANDVVHANDLVVSVSFELLGMAKKCRIAVKRLKGKAFQAAEPLLDAVQRISLTGHNACLTPEAKFMLPLVNTAGKLEAEGCLRHAADAYTLSAMAFQAGRKHIQSVELLAKARRILKGCFLETEKRSRSQATAGDGDQGVIVSREPSVAQALLLLRRAKLAALGAEIHYINGREPAAVPLFFEAADLWSEYRKLTSGEAEAKERLEETQDEADLDPWLAKQGAAAFAGHVASHSATIGEAFLFHRDQADRLADMFITCLGDQTEYFRNVALNGLQFIIEACGNSIGRKYSSIVRSLFETYTARQQAVETNPADEAVTVMHSMHRLNWAIDSSYQIIPNLRPELLAGFVESWGWEALLSRKGYEPVTQIYRFLYLAAANAGGRDISVPDEVLDVVVRDIIEPSVMAGGGSGHKTNVGTQGADRARNSADPADELRAAARRLWSVLVATMLSPPECNRTPAVLRYVTTRISLIAAAAHQNSQAPFHAALGRDDHFSAREQLIKEAKLALYVDVLDHVARALSGGARSQDRGAGEATPAGTAGSHHRDALDTRQHAAVKERSGMALVETVIGLMELLEMQSARNNGALFARLWDIAIQISQSIPDQCRPALSAAVSLMLEHFAKKIRDFSPTENALAALATILSSVEPDPELRHVLLNQVLPSFCERIPHTTSDEVFACLSSLLLMLRAELDAALLDKVLAALVDRFTIRSAGRHRAVKRFITVVLTVQRSGPAGPFYPWLDWVVRKCVIHNPLLESTTPAPAPQLRPEAADSKCLAALRDFSVELLAIGDLAIFSARPFHFGFENGEQEKKGGLVTLHPTIMRACKALADLADLAVIRHVLGFIVTYHELLFESANNSKIRWVPAMPDAFTSYIDFLCQTCIRYPFEETLVITSLGAIRSAVKQFSAVSRNPMKKPKLHTILWKILGGFIKSQAVSRRIRAECLGSMVEIISAREFCKTFFSASDSSLLVHASVIDEVIFGLFGHPSWEVRVHAIRCLFTMACRLRDDPLGLSRTEIRGLFKTSVGRLQDLQEHGRPLVSDTARQLSNYLALGTSGSDTADWPPNTSLLDAPMEVMEYAPQPTVRHESLIPSAELRPILPDEDALRSAAEAAAARGNSFLLRPASEEAGEWAKLDTAEEAFPSSRREADLECPGVFTRLPEALKDFLALEDAHDHVKVVFQKYKIGELGNGLVNHEMPVVFDDQEDFQELGIIDLDAGQESPDLPGAGPGDGSAPADDSDSW